MDDRGAPGILSIGVDVVEVDRVGEAIRRHPDRFPDRVFTAEERRYASAGARPAERFAARYAAKEAVMKALGTGWADGVAFRDIEVVRGAAGRPEIHLRGAAARRAEAAGVETIHLSLSHTRATAVAMVVFSGRRR